MYNFIPPNKVGQKEGYYISYNSSSSGYSDYGGITTAVVTNDMRRFLILMGDHRKPLEALGSYSECEQYVKDNIDRLSRVSDDPFSTETNADKCDKIIM